MKQQLIDRLKALGLKNTQIESDLSLPKNSLSAVLNNHKPMPDKWVDPVQQYLFKKEPPPTPAKPIKDPLRPWIEEMEEYCKSKGFHPEYLIEFHQTHANKETTKALEKLKKSLNPTPTSEKKAINPSDPINKQMKQAPEGTTAYYLRNGVYYEKDLK